MLATELYVSPDEARAQKLRSLQTAESLAMLDESFMGRHDEVSDDDGGHYHTPDSPLSLHISLRRGRVALLVGGVIFLVVSVTLTLARGAELERFDRAELSASDQARLLDRYNSYSGNVASALGRPLELFLVLMAQVLVLWFMTDHVMARGTTTHWHAKLAVVALGAVIGFLLLNGLNALNVQVRELPVTVVMSTSDLTVQKLTTINGSTLERSFSEREPQNPSTNTILRNLIMPRAANKLKCKNESLGIQEDVIGFRLPQREWMKSLLPVALPAASTVRIDLKANATVSSPNDFPMNAAAAADLLIYGIYTGADYAPFDVETPITDMHPPIKVYNITSTNKTGYAPTSRLAGLLPPALNATEAEDRAWFLARSTEFLRATTAKAYQNQTALFRWTMELSRVTITPSLWMEAVTLESEMIPQVKAMKWLDAAWYLEGADSNRASSAAHQIFAADERTHAGAVVNAFASCVNRNKTTALHSFVDIRNYSLEATSSTTLDCAAASTTEMLVFASSKYLVADALDDKFNKFNTSAAPTSVIKNPRVVYSTTIARVRWNLQNLSEVYGAACRDDGGCLGLDAALSGVDQRLLVGANALPLNELSNVKSPNISGSRALQPVEMVNVRRPTQVTAKSYGLLTTTNMAETKHPWLGEIVLPHNIGSISVRGDLDGESCAIALERRVRNYVDNHIYMEGTLQPAYLAATFFLFQDGVAKNVLPSSTSAPGRVVSLKLEGNIQEMSVWLSIPRSNVIQTLTGCVLLVAALVAALVRPHFTATAQRVREPVTTPHQIARVMVDDATFPSLLLERRVTHKTVEGDASDFFIDLLSVRPAAHKTEEKHEVDV